MQDKMAAKSSHGIGMTPNRHGQSPQRIGGKVFRSRLKPDKISGTQKIAGQSPNKTGMTPKIVGLKPIHWESTELSGWADFYIHPDQTLRRALIDAGSTETDYALELPLYPPCGIGCPKD